MAATHARVIAHPHAWRVRLLWCAIALCALAYCGFRFAGPSPLETNLLALVPPDRADPLIDKAVDSLANALGDRTVLLVTSPDDAHAKAAARALGQSLAKSGAFRNVTAELPPFDITQIARLYLPHRFGLLTADDRRAVQNATPATLKDALARRLYSPMRGPLATSLTDDPFGWLEHWLGGLPFASTALGIEDNLLVAHRDNQTSVMIVTTLPGSAYEPDVQRRVIDAVSAGEGSLKTSFPDVKLARAGAVFYAQAARHQAEGEAHRIGVVSLAGIALLMLWVFRSPRLLLLGFVSTALGIVCALAATFAIFGKLHLLTLVFGASLIGEAVDYSIQYFVVYLGRQKSGQLWDARRGAREVRPALAVALATSLFGYAALAWVPFPALRQIACFAVVGIAVAFASVLSLLPSLLTRAPRRRPERLFARAESLLRGWQRWIGAGRAVWVAGFVVIVSVPGWIALTSDDDIHLLVDRDAALVAQENAVRNAVGVDNTAQFFLVRGPSAEAVLQRAETLGARLDTLGGTPDDVGPVQSIASFVPSAHSQQAARALLAQHVFADPPKLRAMLVASGFRPEVAAAWLAAWRDSGAQPAPLTVDAWLAAPWSQPFRYLWLGNVSHVGNAKDEKHANNARFATLVVPQNVTSRNLPALQKLAQSTDGVVFVDKAASVSALFGAYRVDSAWWLAGALALVLVLLCVRYGVKGGIATTLPVVLAVCATLAVFGYLRVPLNLFNWLALMLVLGVGANYAVFLREGRLRADAELGAVWTGVLLSAATTLLSFGLLGASATPALKSFGGTLALGIGCAVLLAPLGMPVLSRRTA